jgi:AraC-like DNA-binding protein
MRYKEFRPPQELRAYVDSFWSGESDLVPLGTTQILPADGVTDIVFSFGISSPFAEYAGVYLAGGNAAIAGQRTRPAPLRFNAGAELFGVRFLPGGLFPFARIPATELTDGVFPLDAFLPRVAELSSRLSGAQDSLERIRIVSGALRNVLNDTERAAAIRRAVGYLTERRGAVSVDELGRLLGVGYRTLDRNFLGIVGMPPKHLAREIRLQCVLQARRRKPDARWASIACDYDYSDQAHLVRDFRELTGTTPARFGRLETQLAHIVVSEGLPDRYSSL